jgi:acyl-CoA thioester hydrolase
MYISESTIRVRYGETDQMGYCYYGNYAQFYEVGRVEALRNIGFSYRSLEESGIMLPVLEFKIKYHKPAFYDDLLKVKTTVHEINGARILFTYEMFNEKNELLNSGETTLVFISKETNRPCAAPVELLERLKGN